MKKNDDLVYVAKIGKAVGLHGSLKLHIKSDFLEQFYPNQKYLLKNYETITIKSFNFDKSEVIFLGYESRNLAQKLTNEEIFSTKEQTRKNFNLKKDEFFYFDIIGLNIYENEILIGKVIDIEKIGSHDYFIVKIDEKMQENLSIKDFHLPYIDKYIVEIALEKQSIFTQNAIELLHSLS